jgi:hypothetical protein
MKIQPDRGQFEHKVCCSRLTANCLAIHTVLWATNLEIGMSSSVITRKWKWFSVYGCESRPIYTVTEFLYTHAKMAQTHQHAKTWFVKLWYAHHYWHTVFIQKIEIKREYKF